jgi:beta-lactamase class A
MLFPAARMSVTWTRCIRLFTVVAMLLIASALSPYAAAQSDPSVPTVCGGESPAGPPVDSALVTWEYSPPIEGATAHLVCAGATIASLIQESPGDWGVAVRDLRTRETLIANADRRFVAGSLYKLGVAAEAYARIDAGSLAEESLVLVSEQDVDPDYGGSRYAAGEYLSVRQAVYAMITQSDNGAALALVDRLGLNAVNLRFASIGMPDTRLVYDAVTTPRDVLSYFSMLADGDVVSPDASNSLVDLLAAQEINDRIPAGLPAGEGWSVAHKTANIDDMIGDAGIVYTRDNDAYALIILNQGLASYWTSVQTIRSISQSVYRVIVPHEDQPD